MKGFYLHKKAILDGSGNLCEENSFWALCAYFM